MRIALKRREVGDIVARSPQAKRAALFAVSENALSDSTKRVPKLRGHLRTSGRAFLSADGKGVIEWGGDSLTARYARAQHAGGTSRVRFRSYTTPGTGADWTGKTSAERADAWRRMFAAVYGRGLRG